MQTKAGATESRKKYTVDPATETARTKSLLKQYVSFLRLYELNPQYYRIDYTILKAVVKRYLMDVERLHNFHDMPRIDCHKIAGYLTYWLCRLKPIVVDKPMAYHDTTPPVKHLRHPFFVNEMFAVCVGIGRINARRISGNDSKGVVMSADLFNSLTYGLKYRPTSGDMLSLAYYMIDEASPKIECQATKEGADACPLAPRGGAAPAALP